MRLEKQHDREPKGAARPPRPACYRSAPGRTARIVICRYRFSESELRMRRSIQEWRISVARRLALGRTQSRKRCGSIIFRVEESATPQAVSATRRPTAAETVTPCPPNPTAQCQPWMRGSGPRRNRPSGANVRWPDQIRVTGGIERRGKRAGSFSRSQSSARRSTLGSPASSLNSSHPLHQIELSPGRR